MTAQAFPIGQASPLPLTRAPINQPAPNVALAPSSQALQQAKQLFKDADYKHFHKQPKLEIFDVSHSSNTSTISISESGGS